MPTKAATPKAAARHLPAVAIVGATGAVGTTLLDLFRERGLKPAALDLVASARSAGREVAFDGATHRVQALEEYDFSRADIAFFSAGTAISRVWAPKAAAAGALVIDNTNAFRMDPATPLVVPQVNGDLLRVRPKSGIVGNPNCSTIPLVRAVKAIDAAFPVERMIVSTYQAASGAGLNGMEELSLGARRVLDGAAAEAKRFPRPLAFDLIPWIDVAAMDGYTLEEEKIRQESRKILDRPSLKVTATAVRVPVFNCHSEAAYLECAAPVDLDEVMRRLRAAPEMVVYEGDQYPTPRQITDINQVHVGRVRRDRDNPNGLWLWVVSDNLRIGAALNAVQIAERAAAEGMAARPAPLRGMVA